MAHTRPGRQAKRNRQQRADKLAELRNTPDYDYQERQRWTGSLWTLPLFGGSWMTSYSEYRKGK